MHASCRCRCRTVVFLLRFALLMLDVSADGSPLTARTRVPDGTGATLIEDMHLGMTIASRSSQGTVGKKQRRIMRKEETANRERSV